MEIIKKIGIALLISIGLVAIAFVLVAPFALIENIYIKMGIAFLLLFGIVLGAICVGKNDCDCDDGKRPKWVKMKKGDEFKEQVMFATAKDLEDGLVSNMIYSKGCTAPEDGYCISFEDIINLPIE